MIVNFGYPLFGPTNARVDAWCDEKYPAPQDNKNCKGCMLPPWTDVGAVVCGLPKAGLVAMATSLATSTPGAPSVPPGAPPSTEEGIFGLPKTVVYVGGGVLALGVVAMVLAKRR